jgi:NADP-dependent 3-hydroxy acid dehydrogenase YdfG
MAPLVWLVTGSTSGIGAALIEHIVSRGDKVIASGRKVEQKLGHLKSDNLALLELDITASFAEISAQINKAWNIFGHIDILMNNAGMSAMRSAEEAE